MSNYSNWGPTGDGRVKPDIMAKGTGINSSYFAIKDTNTPSDTRIAVMGTIRVVPPMHHLRRRHQPFCYNNTTIASMLLI